MALEAFGKSVVNHVVNSVSDSCYFVNDTKYHVQVVDYDGTRDLKPGMSELNVLLVGFSRVRLVMHIQGEEKMIKFSARQYQNRTHKMSVIFREHIPNDNITVLKAFSEWRYAFSHPGGYEAKYSSTVETKNSWKKMKEEGSEFEAKARGMIKAIELSASFKAHTNLTRTDEYEEAITKSSELKFIESCTIYQEVIIVKTNKTAPFDELRIPTYHTYNSQEVPGKEKLIFCKGN